MNYRLLIVSALLALVALGCVGGPLVSAALTPTPLTQPATTVSPRPTPTIRAAGKAAVPAWWPADLAMPPGAEMTSSTKNQAIWTTRDVNVDSLKDLFVRQAQAAGYRVYDIAVSKGSIYDLLFVKGSTAFFLNITHGTDSTVMTGQPVGTMHIEITGAVNLTLDLPLRERLNLSPGSEVVIGTSIPNAQCANCEYLVYVRVAPFNGPGIYQSKPAGIAIIDAQVVPGGNSEKEDYRWAQQCTVIVQDAQRGNLACAGLENVNDNTRRINVIGSWQQPP
ncbi:MAG: hypothetical protein HY782_07510 [Chloroflexi bacterium]|nr:hypothetical protein [Chloroflexota bacterium]